MDRFLDRLTVKYNGMTMDPHQSEPRNRMFVISLSPLVICLSVDNETAHRAKLPIVRDMFPHLDDETLAYYLEVYSGNIDAIAHELTG